MKNLKLKKLSRPEQKNIKGSGIKSVVTIQIADHTNAVQMLSVYIFPPQNANQFKEYWNLKFNFCTSASAGVFLSLY